MVQEFNGSDDFIDLKSLTSGEARTSTKVDLGDEGRTIAYWINGDGPLIEADGEMPLGKWVHVVKTYDWDID